MFIARQIECIRVILRMRVSRMKESKIDCLLNVISSLSYLVLNLLFWVLIDGIGFSVQGWSRSDIFVFLAYSELFFGLDAAIFSSASRFWYVIYSGMLDVFMTKPQDPRKRFILLNFDFMGTLTSFVSFGVLLAVSGRRINVISMLLGIVFVIIASVVLGYIRSILSYMAFWHGKMDAISELSDALTWFNKYPLTIIPSSLRIIFTVCFPFFFFSTFSAQVVNRMLGTSEELQGIAVLLVGAVVWKLIDSFVWKKGLSRYESING